MKDLVNDHTIYIVFISFLNFFLKKGKILFWFLKFTKNLFSFPKL